MPSSRIPTITESVNFTIYFNFQIFVCDKFSEFQEHYEIYKFGKLRSPRWNFINLIEILKNSLAQWFYFLILLIVGPFSFSSEISICEGETEPQITTISTPSERKPNSTMERTLSGKKIYLLNATL